jgi:hypothetical protein
MKHEYAGLNISAAIFNDLNNAAKEKLENMKKTFDGSLKTDKETLNSYSAGLWNMTEYIVANYTLTKK